MYHSISDDAETGHPYYWINTSPALFAQHLQYLHDNDYQVIPLTTAVELIRGNSKFQSPNSNNAAVNARKPVTCNVQPATGSLLNTKHQTPNTKSVVLTFDDGYADFYSDAFPVLKKLGFTATVFLPTDYIGNGRPGLRGKQHLTWEQVRELAAQGITFGSHTCTHPQLAELSLQDAEQELRRSKQVFEEQGTGCAGTFCYPFRFPEQNAGFMEGFNETLQRVGYEACASTRVGTINTAEDMLALKRIPVNSGDDVALFEAKLRGAYDWLAGVQSAAKRLRSRPSKSQSLLHAEPVTRNP
jgi:hypothetical protein